MSKYQRNIVLLLITGLFLFPFIVPDETTTLLPSEGKYVIIHLMSPELSVESSNNAKFVISLFRLDSDEALISIPVSDQAQSKFTVQDLTPGQYQIYMESNDITTITISQSGIYSVSLILVVVINAMNLYSFAKKYYFDDY